MKKKLIIAEILVGKTKKETYSFLEKKYDLKYGGEQSLFALEKRRPMSEKALVIEFNNQEIVECVREIDIEFM